MAFHLAFKTNVHIKAVEYIHTSPKGEVVNKLSPSINSEMLNNSRKLSGPGDFKDLTKEIIV